MKAPAQARVYRGSIGNLRRLARELRAGGLVAVPTETVYGLAANAFDARACRAIFRAKGRPANDPLIVHIHSLAQLDELAFANEAARLLARAFWPGPLTLVLPKKPAVPDVVSSGLPSVAVRMPRHPVFRRLLGLAGLPLAAPSANPFGYVSPTTAQHVLAGLGGRIDHILDGGSCPIGVESTIVDLRNPRAPRLLRPGAITRADLERVLGVRVRTRKASRAAAAPVAPGLLSRHYSPRTPTILHHRIPSTAVKRSPADEAWIFQQRPRDTRSRNVLWFSERGGLQSVAHNLFRVLRQADERDFARLHVERAHGEGLAEAINDRLARAAGAIGGRAQTASSTRRHGR